LISKLRTQIEDINQTDGVAFHARSVIPITNGIGREKAFLARTFVTLGQIVQKNHEISLDQLIEFDSRQIQYGWVRSGQPHCGGVLCGRLILQRPNPEMGVNSTSVLNRSVTSAAVMLGPSGESVDGGNVASQSSPSALQHIVQQVHSTSGLGSLQSASKPSSNCWVAPQKSASRLTVKAFT
jgi:hypothetical protein